ncbi:hypothetical protein BRADI_4g06180v3 [Brachypodium distachyon]|uniref:F-box domain-containing protein n=2 Tax=Brachypodium distachyon TaxID=15368 RepID=I1II05_BRADI|nr:hypothetical protein BRADI_4g06180v3 [Brachypodium distachyon]
MDIDFEFVLRVLPAPSVSTTGSLSAAADGGHDGEDHLSNLPDGLLGDIVSLLPVTFAMRTTVLSERWRNVWHSAPLVLYDAHIPAASKSARFAIVARVFAKNTGAFRTVHLARCSFESRAPELAECSRRLAAGGVQDLVLLNEPIERSVGRDEEILPAEILRCDALRSLYLGYWKLADVASLPGGDFFPKLEKLGLLNMFLGNHVLDRLLAASPLLTHALILWHQRPDDRLHLRGQSLRCVVFYHSTVEELALLDAPLLDRLIMRCTWRRRHKWDPRDLMRVKIARAPRLRVLGYLDAMEHQLQIGDTVIQADTLASPRSVVPSVRVLAVMVNLNAFEQVKALFSFLSCFPNLETLHVKKSAVAAKPNSLNPEKFFQNLGPIECLQSHIKKVVLHDVHFLGDIPFLRCFCQRAQALQSLVLMVRDELAPVLLGGMDLASYLAYPTRAGQCCTVLFVNSDAEGSWSYHRSSDLSVDDPFFTQGGQQLFHISV